MSAVQPYDPETGEVVEQLASDTTVAVAMARAEIDQAISTARAYPRNPARAVKMIEQMVMLDEESAGECIYALPRGGKPIKGPSVRFAEIVASQYGNCHVVSRVVAVDKIDKVVIAEGVFLDLETGFKRMAQVRRRITDKNGRLYNDDMIVVTGNAAASIAMREAVLKGIPKAVWRRAYERAEQVVNGDVKTLAERRSKAVTAFAAYGITPERICEALEIKSLEEIDLERIGTLTAMFKSIRDGEVPVEEYFPEPKGAAAVTSKGSKPKTLADLDAPPAGPAPTDEESAPPPDPAPATQGAAEDGPDQAAIDDAYAKGREAARKGRRADSVPAALKAKPELAAAWANGWQEEDNEANAS